MRLRPKHIVCSHEELHRTSIIHYSVVLVHKRAICFYLTTKTHNTDQDTHWSTDFIWIRNMCPAHFLQNSVSDRKKQRKGRQTANLLSTCNILQTFSIAAFFLPVVYFHILSEPILSSTSIPSQMRKKTLPWFFVSRFKNQHTHTHTHTHPLSLNTW